jgi:hypothetical protein
VVAVTLSAVGATSVLGGLAGGSLLAMAPGIAWVHETRTASDTFVSDAAADGAGLYLVGYAHGVWPATTGADAFLRRLDLLGKEVWVRQFGTSEFDQATSVAVQSDAVYVVGSTEGTLPDQIHVGSRDAFVRKYSPNGDEGWTRQFGTTASDRALATAVDDTGVVVAGVTEGALPGQTPAGLTDVFLRKYAFDGTELWARQFGSVVGDWPADVVADETGVYVLLTAEDALPPWAKAVILQKFDAQGNTLWVRQFGTSGSEQAVAMAANGQGVYIATATERTWKEPHDADDADESFLRGVDPDGNERWTRSLGPLNAQRFGIAADETGIYRVDPGETRELGTFPRVDKYDYEGTAVWGGELRKSDAGSLATCRVSAPAIILTTETGPVLVGSRSVLAVIKVAPPSGDAWFSDWSPRLPFVGAAAMTGLAFVVLRRRAKNAPDSAE